MSAECPHRWLCREDQAKLGDIRTTMRYAHGNVEKLRAIVEKLSLKKFCP